MFKSNRRAFLKGIGAATAATLGGCRSVSYPSVSRLCAPRFRKPGEKIRVGIVGVGGKGFTDWTKLFEHGEEIVAFCDPDRTQIDASLKYLQSKGGDPSKVLCFSDWRKMLETCAGRLDAITVSTPDHMHAPIAITAMRQGLHCHVQKPLVRTIWEARYFEKVAKTCGVVTQMGNQGSAGVGHRRNVELLQQGVIGDVQEVHVWTDRPIWPQGLTAQALSRCAAAPVPSTFDWDGWLGTAAARPYVGDRPASVKVTFRNKWAEGIKGVYHQFNWRGFYDFGTGAFGDMACHTMNLPFRGAELGLVTKARCISIEEKNDVAYPTKSVVEVTYAARKSRVRKGATLPEVKLFWYDGDQQPSADLMPQYIATFGAVPMTGCLIKGTKGMIISTNDYGQEAFIALNGEKKVKSTTKHEACKALPEIIAKSPIKNDLDFVNKAEFCDAIKGVGPVYDMTHSRCFADVEHSVPMLEGMLVGCIAQRVPGELNWDSANQTFDVAEANALVKPYVRSGWEF